GGARADARVRDPDQRGHVRARPRHPHRRRQVRLQDRRARRHGHPARPASRPAALGGRARGGHPQSLGRALVQARAQLHGEPGVGALRPRHRGSPARPRDAEAVRVPRGRGDRGGARGRLRGRAHLGHRSPALRGCGGGQGPSRGGAPGFGGRGEPRRRAPVHAAGRDARPAHRGGASQRLRGARGPAPRRPRPAQRGGGGGVPVPRRHREAGPRASRGALSPHPRRGAAGMKIAAIETLHADGGWRDFDFVKLTTDTGIVGWSEYNENFGGPGGGTGMIAELAPPLVGKDARAWEAQVALMYALRRQATGGGGQQAIGAIENALLDVKAPALGLPVYALLGGALPERIRLYWSHCATYRVGQRAREMQLPPVRTLDDIVKVGKEVVAKGYNALKTNVLLLGGDHATGHVPGFARGAGFPELNADRHIV